MEIFKQTEKYTVIHNFLPTDEWRKIRMFAESIDDDLFTDSKTIWPGVLWNEGATVENGIRVFPFNKDGIGNWKYNLHNEECIALFQDKLVSYFAMNVGIDIANSFKVFETKINKGPNGSSLFWHTDNHTTYGISYYVNKR